MKREKRKIKKNRLSKVYILIALFLLLFTISMLLHAVYAQKAGEIGKEIREGARRAPMMEGKTDIRRTESKMLSESVYKLVRNRVDDYNAAIEKRGLPEAAGFLLDMRANFYVGDEKIGIVFENGKVKSVVEGGIENPTNEFKTTRKFFNRILKSENKLVAVAFGLKYGFIVRKDHGIAGKIKGKMIERAVENIVKRRPKLRKRIARKLAEIGERRGNVIVIPRERAGFRRASIEIRGGEGVENSDIEIEEYDGYVENAPEGIKRIELGKGERDLGSYIKLNLRNPDIEEITLKLHYSDEELDYNLIDEDSLKIKYFDEKNGKWITVSPGNPDFVREVGINKEENFVYARLSHASIYALSGSVTTPEKIEEKRDIEPAYFESPEEVKKIREKAERKGIIDRIIDFILSLIFRG